MYFSPIPTIFTAAISTLYSENKHKSGCRRNTVSVVFIEVLPSAAMMSIT